ncbi:MAG: MYG1 family protein [Candidatus Saccharibacteria bacterium]|nr:MYG1 family protein [Candidatus Saccharibacteria bacterium]
MKVAIHSGRFHSDEAFALATLKMLGPVDYVRTRDESVMQSCDMRVDVGRKYNPVTNDFDHHQPEGAGKRENGIPYDAFGLIWKEYGAKVCDSKEVAIMVDKRLVQVMDAIDSGFDLFEQKVDGVRPFGIDKAVDDLMPSWKSNPSPEQIDKAFESAIILASQVLENVINRARDRVDADNYVRNAIKNAADERLIILDQYAPWEEVVVKEAPNALFVVLPAWPSPEDDWALKAISVKLGSYENRKKLPANWAGKINSELAEVTGVKDAKFCHASRFLAIAKSKEGCLQLAELALK